MNATTTMTAEELAEIRKRHASDQRTYEYAAESAGSTRPFGGFGPKQHQDRADLLTHTDAQAQRIAELESQLAACEQRLDHTLIAYQEASSGVPDTAKIDYQSSQSLIADWQLAARGPDREALVAHFRSRIPPPFAAPETLAQEGFIERWKVRADKKAREEADALLASSALATAQAVTLTEAARDVLDERKRQVSVEGWTPEHDDEHCRGEMARAAACYAVGERLFIPMNHHNGFPDLQAVWPWDRAWWKPTTPRRNLVKAAALILAEIERLDRLTQATAAGAKP